MNKAEFLQQLAGALSGMPPEERDNALQYYEDYFADAGEGNEEQVISDLGDPKAVAQAILNDYRDLAILPEQPGEEASKKAAGSGAAYWNARYRESRGYKSSASETDQTGPKDAPPRRAGLHPALLVLLIIFAIPIGAPILGALFALLVAGVAVIASFAIALIAILFATLLSGVVLFVRGLLVVVATPFSAIATMGIGVILAAIGLLTLLLTIKLFAVVIPACIRGIVRLCRLPFERRKSV